MKAKALREISHHRGPRNVIGSLQDQKVKESQRANSTEGSD